MREKKSAPPSNARRWPAPCRVPDNWELLQTHGHWRFPTRLEYRLKGGGRVVWKSRRARKGFGLSIPEQPAHTAAEALTAASGTVDPRLQRLTQAAACAFMVGSTLFGAGAAGELWDLATPTVDNVLFFIGALFFTTAAAVQCLQIANADASPAAPINPAGESPETSRRNRAGAVAASAPRQRTWRLLVWRPSNIDWWVVYSLLVGTLWFNVLTATEFAQGLAARREDAIVWTPDAIGSALFLLSGYLALGEACHGSMCLEPQRVTWWVTSTNLAGCLAFGVSVIAAFILPSGNTLAEGMANGGTLAGAVGFFVSAALMLFERDP